MNKITRKLRIAMIGPLIALLLLGCASTDANAPDTIVLATDGIISLARAGPGAANAAAFFICIGDQPGLDFGAKRNRDGLGFAAFGKVIAGMDVVFAIHQRGALGPSDSDYMRGQIITQPV